eukprot:s3417_g9.t1
MATIPQTDEEEMETSQIFPSANGGKKVSHWLSRVRASFIVPAVGLMGLGVFALGAMREIRLHFASPISTSESGRLFSWERSSPRRCPIAQLDSTTSTRKLRAISILLRS